MAHALLEQHFEVLPLYGRGVLKLVYHHVAQLCSDFLEDEGRVGVADEGVEQVPGVTEQQDVGLLVDVLHRLLNAVQQPEVVEVAQREARRVDVASQLTAAFGHVAQQGDQRLVGQGYNLVAHGVLLRNPVAAIFETRQCSLPHDFLLIDTLAEVDEQGSHASLSVAQVVNGESVVL